VEGLDRTYVIARADYLGEPVLIEFGRLRLPPARRDVFGGDANGLEAGFGDSKRRGGRAQGFEADLLQGPLELDAILRGTLAGLEFVQEGFGAVDEAFVVDDRGVEGRDEFEKVGLAFEEVGEEIGILGQGTELEAVFAAPHFEFPASGEEPRHGDLPVRRVAPGPPRPAPPGDIHEPRPALGAQPGAGGHRALLSRFSFLRTQSRSSTSSATMREGRC
jgi:hypothetical protein